MNRSVLPLAPTTDALEVLADLDAWRPDYVVAGVGVAWDGVRAQPWFVERYRQLAAWRPTAQPDDAVVLFGYTPTPFDRGERVPVEARFESDAVALHAFRLSHVRLTPGELLYITLYWESRPGYDMDAVRTHLRLVDVATGGVWAASTARLGAHGFAPLDSDGRFAARYSLSLPDDLPQGAFRLTVQVEELSGRYVPVAGQPEAQLELATVERPPDVSSVPIGTDHVVRFTFSESQGTGRIILSGYDVEDCIAPGDALRLALLWSATGPVAEGYTVFAHMVAPDGTLAAQSDGVPVFGFHPTNTWAAGDYVRDQHLIEVPAETPRGDYTLSVGLYEPTSGERLVVVDGDANPLPENRVLLHTVRVR